MKNWTLLLLFTVTTMLFSCNNDDDASNNVDIEGVWNLTHVSEGFAGVDIEIDPGLVIWTFEDASLEIVHNLSTDHPYSREPGTYSYSVVQSNNANYLMIDIQQGGGLFETGDVLVIDQNERIGGGQANDGYVYTFER